MMKSGLLFFIVILSACSNIKEDAYRPKNPNSLFKRLGPEETGLEFINAITTTNDLNVFVTGIFTTAEVWVWVISITMV
jgi:hypothetical protein